MPISSKKNRHSTEQKVFANRKQTRFTIAMIHHITAKLEGIRSETDCDSGAALSNKYTNKFATFDQYVTDYYLEIYRIEH